MEKINKQGKSKGFYITLWGMILLIGILSVGYAYTYVSDTGINTPSITLSGGGTAGNWYVDNLFFGSRDGDLNETSALRQFTTNGDVTKTVCASGCDYTKVNDAIKQVPLLLRHSYTINIRNSYNQHEDVYIPTVIGMTLSPTEGSIGGLSINGNSSNDEAVVLNSIQISNPIGQWTVGINNLKVNGTEPTSDEVACISVYGDGFVGLGNINITGNCTHAVMGYGSGIYLVNSHLNGQQYGLYIKRKGVGIFGDDYCEPSCGNSSNDGWVTTALVRTQNALIEINSENEVAAPRPDGCTAGGNGIISYEGKAYCLGPTGSGNVTDLVISSLTSTYTGGSAYMCVYNNGTLFASESACP